VGRRNGAALLLPGSISRRRLPVATRAHLEHGAQAPRELGAGEARDGARVGLAERAAALPVRRQRFSERSGDSLGVFAPHDATAPGLADHLRRLPVGRQGQDRPARAEILEQLSGEDAARPRPLFDQQEQAMAVQQRLHRLRVGEISLDPHELIQRGLAKPGDGVRVLHAHESDLHPIRPSLVLPQQRLQSGDQPGREPLPREGPGVGQGPLRGRARVPSREIRPVEAVGQHVEPVRIGRGDPRQEIVADLPVHRDDGRGTADARGLQTLVDPAGPEGSWRIERRPCPGVAEVQHQGKPGPFGDSPADPMRGEGGPEANTRSTRSRRAIRVASRDPPTAIRRVRRE